MTMGTIEARTVLRALYLELTAEYDAATRRWRPVLRPPTGR